MKFSPGFIANAKTPFVPPVDGTPLYFFLSDDIDGDGSRKTDVERVATWTNKGSAGDLTAATGDDAYRQPTIALQTIAGRPAVSSNGASNYMTADGSESVMKQWHTTGSEFEFFLLFRTVQPSSTPLIFGSGLRANQNNFIIYRNSSNKIRVDLRSTAGSVAFLTGPTIANGNLYLLNVHANGADMAASIDGGVTENTTTRNNLVADADMARGFVGPGAYDTSYRSMSIDYYMLWYDSTELSSGDRLAFYNAVKAAYENVE